MTDTLQSLEAECAASEAELAHAKKALADYEEMMRILRPVMQAHPERTVGEAMALLSPEDAARVVALAPRQLKVRR